MANSGEAQAKICTACGENVSGKARTKDARGRYFCKPCYEQAAARARPTPATARAAARAAVATDDEADILAGLSGGSTTPGAAQALKACPGCRGGMAADAVICTNCGFDFRTGKKTQMKISQTTAEQRAKGQRGGAGLGLPGFLTNPVAVGLGLFAFFGVLVMVALTTPALAGPAVIVFVLCAAAVQIWLLATAFLDSVTQGLLTLCVPFYAIYYAFVRNENPHLKAAYAAALIFTIIVRYATNFGFDPNSSATSGGAVPGYIADGPDSGSDPQDAGDANQP